MVRRRRYTKEFKQEAIDMVLRQGMTTKQAASDLGIGKSALDKWVRDYRRRREDPTKLSEEEFEELKRLRKENRLLRMERDLLKKTTIYFAKTTEGGVNL